MAKQRVHPIFTDTKFNSIRVVYLNLYHNFVLTAMKMYQYLKNLGTDSDRNHHYLLGRLSPKVRGHNRLLIGLFLAVIDKTLLFTWYSIRNRMASSLAKENNAYCRATDTELVW